MPVRASRAGGGRRAWAAAGWLSALLAAASACAGGAGSSDPAPVLPCGAAAAPAADGTPCGTDQVCSAGACVGCVEGEACASPDPCHLASTSCAAGPSCVVAGPVADGTPCASGVCLAGACVTGLPGSACTPADPCHQGTLAEDGLTCVDGGVAQPGGFPCGTVADPAVCTEGVCLPCIEGEICMTGAACQYQSRMSCTYGAYCISGDYFPDGATCGPGRVCLSGQCVSSGLF